MACRRMPLCRDAAPLRRQERLLHFNECFAATRQRAGEYAYATRELRIMRAARRARVQLHQLHPESHKLIAQAIPARFLLAPLVFEPA